jgi:membrane protease YdiL (CAAX protease family)
MSLLGALIVSAVLTAGLTSRDAWPRLVVEQFPGALRRLLAYAVLTFTLAVTAILPLSRIGHPAPAVDLARMSTPELFLGHAILAAALLSWWALAGFRPLPAFLHLRLDRPRQQLLAGIKVGIGGWLITMIVMTAIGTLFGVGRDAASGGVKPEVPEMVQAIVGLSVLTRIVLVCSAGFFEELFFRSFLQARGGLVLSTLLFTASHASYGMPFMLVGVFTVSIILGRTFEKNGADIVPCMIAHAVFDAIQLFVILPLVVAGG